MLAVVLYILFKKYKPVKTSPRDEASLEVAVLAALAGGCPATVQDLAQRVGADPLRLVPVLDRLVRDGLVAVVDKDGGWHYCIKQISST